MLQLKSLKVIKPLRTNKSYDQKKVQDALQSEKADDKFVVMNKAKIRPTLEEPYESILNELQKLSSTYKRTFYTALGCLGVGFICAYKLNPLFQNFPTISGISATDQLYPIFFLLSVLGSLKLYTVNIQRFSLFQKLGQKKFDNLIKILKSSSIVSYASLIGLSALTYKDWFVFHHVLALIFFISISIYANADYRLLNNFMNLTPITSANLNNKKLYLMVGCAKAFLTVIMMSYYMYNSKLKDENGEYIVSGKEKLDLWKTIAVFEWTSILFLLTSLSIIY